MDQFDIPKKVQKKWKKWDKQHTETQLNGLIKCKEEENTQNKENKPNALSGGGQDTTMILSKLLLVRIFK